MKKSTRIACVGMALFLLSTLAVFGQNSVLMRVNVPFEFTVDTTTFPAGSYLVERMSNIDRVYLLRSQEGKGVVFSIASAQPRLRSGDNAQLVFDKVDNRYFLSAFRLAGSEPTKLLFTSKLEKELLAKTGQTKEPFPASGQ